MYQRLTALVLRWLRVPPEPHPPHGDAGSLRVFRAGKNLYRLRLARWALGQLLALAGIVFWIAVFLGIEAGVRERQQTDQTRVNPTETRNFDEYLDKIGATQKTTPPAPNANPAPAPTSPQKAKAKPRVRINGWAGFKLMLVQVALWLPPWAFPLLWALKIVGILAYLAQLPFTYLIVRLDYELRWFMVTDRSLRIRHGVWRVSEATMSFANIQQVAITRGPIQGLLGLADVRVQSAGGGGGGHHSHSHRRPEQHLGHFENVTNATEIRDLILERLRQFRATGLGDPDDHREHQAAPAPTSSSAACVATPEMLAAARELLAEARALRATLSSPAGP